MKSQLVVLLSLCFSLSIVSCTTKKQPPNVILILVDDWGWTDGKIFGSDLYQTPAIDKLASEGVRFTNAYASCTVCSPTRASIITGKYPARLRVTDWIPGFRYPNAKLLPPPDWNMKLRLEELTIPEVLKQKGYSTAHIGKWHLGGEDFYPEKQGFDINIGGTHKGHPPSYFSPYKIATLADGAQGEYLTDRESSETSKFIEKNKDNPFFIYLAHHAVHTPIQPRPEVQEKYKALIKDSMTHQHAGYAAMIQSVDESLKHIVTTLRENDLLDNTYIIMTGDNGGLIRKNKGAPITLNSPLREGKGSAYEGGIRVPMVIWGPQIKSGVTDEPAISCDVAPTIYDLCEANPGSEILDGISLTPVLFPTRDTMSREKLFWHYPHYHAMGATPHSAIRKGAFKLIEFYEDGRTELYNLQDDISESKNLTETLPDKRDELVNDLHKWRSEVNAQNPVLNPLYKKDSADYRKGSWPLNE